MCPSIWDRTCDRSNIQAPREHRDNKKRYVNLTDTTLTPDQQDLLNMGLNCHYMTKPKPHQKRLKMEILLDYIHQLERKTGKLLPQLHFNQLYLLKPPRRGESTTANS
ncbi:hypothetical protein Pcinc_001269 [Petrolisthes cinctipes]|uniref:Uncharacterized protein n=1 Tax=Petrolisthes cinctipes TaxID=88211 RepID=A0AAE1GN78_PETCI|nr:hypothetical protein Pcinc_001269 [Petrolisthes cinctipes]